MNSNLLKSPNFFIVGAPKCGTTSLDHYLKQHPQIFMPDRKEPHFFGTDVKARYFIRDKQQYLNLYSNVKGQPRIGDASVWYLYSKLAALEIKEFCPAAKIIIMLRHPVDMIYSLHSHRLYNGGEDIENFEEALRAEEKRKLGLCLPPGTVGPIPAFPVDGLFYRSMAKYSSHVERYLAVFGRSNVHIIIFDDFSANPALSYQQTLRFLEVDDTVQIAFDVINPNKTVKNKAIHGVLSNLRQLAWKYHLSTRLGFVNKLARLNTHYVKRLPLSPEVRSRLREEFVPDIEKLSALVERDLVDFWR